MPFFVAAFLLLLLLVFWGLGPAWLLTPRRWRRYWVFFVPIHGVALQSAVVWFAARHTSVAGAQVYGKIALLVPLVLLVAAWRRRGGWPALREGAGRGAGVAIVMTIALFALLSPLGSVSRTLTTVSLGSCDAADYAAGARVLGEYSRDDRSGFIGHTEVVREHSVDNFFDYWLRLNHFTPSALLALGNATFGWRIHETVSVLAAVLMAATLPLVFWLARSLFRFGPWLSAWVALIYGLSPLTWYGVWHVAIGQSLAAAGVALLTWCGVVLWRFGADWRRAAGFSGLLVVAYWILLGSFNFIVVICLVPALAYAGGQALRSGRWQRLGAWLAAMLVPLLATAVLFSERALGLAERFLLFAEHDFGWKIPVLFPDGWLGLVADANLTRLPSAMAWSLAAFFTGLLGYAVVRGFRAGARGVFLVLAAVVPVATGYVYLELRARGLGSNQSYDAYKVLAVFYPVVLPALCFWGARASLRGPAMRVLAAGAVAVITFGHVRTARQTAARMEQPPLVVSPELVQVQAVEDLAQVGSVNLLIDDFWARLWANAFLLRKAQYFQGYTYEGRRGTVLRGEWDLIGGLVQARTSDGVDGFVVGSQFSLLRVGGPHHLRAHLTEGWYDLEQAPRTPPWRWTQAEAKVLVENSQPHPLRVTLAWRGGSLVERDLQVWRNDERVFRAEIGIDSQQVDVPVFTLAPGRNVLALKSDVPPVRPGPADRRELGLMVTRLEIVVQVDEGAGRN